MYAAVAHSTIMVKGRSDRPRVQVIQVIGQRNNGFVSFSVLPLRCHIHHLSACLCVFGSYMAIIKECCLFHKFPLERVLPTLVSQI